MRLKYLRLIQEITIFSALDQFLVDVINKKASNKKKEKKKYCAKTKSIAKLMAKAFSACVPNQSNNEARVLQCIPKRCK